MLNFHRLLDRVFRQKISFSIFVRIWLTFAVVTVLSMGLAFYYVGQTIKPSAKRVVEDALVDTSRLLASLVADDVATQDADALQRTLNTRLTHAFVSADKVLWYDQKDKSSYHLYITDRHGTVIYDSRQQSLGADFSRWNDVYLTLQGKYGARSTDVAGHSIMYVASPILYQGDLVGVLSVGKPTQTLIPYINKSRNEVIKIILAIMVLTLTVATFMAWWLRHSIHSVNRYTQGLASSVPPHFYLGRELNELMTSIHTMKDVIENKAYVTDYVHTLTHELKSPLTAIRASGEILSDELTAAEKQQFTSIILAQTDKLTALVDRLLSLAKIEQPNFRPDKVRLNLGWLISHCLDLKSANLKQLGKTIRFESSDCVLMGDEFWLGQALLNLLDNAIRYGNTTIAITLTQDADHTTVTIANDSCRLDDFVIAKAFDRYFSMSNDQQKSTGLGLTLVKQVVELHAGSVTLTQSKVQDTYWVKVTMTLPNA